VCNRANALAKLFLRLILLSAMVINHFSNGHATNLLSSKIKNFLSLVY
jgi:hypothetical protein